MKNKGLIALAFGSFAIGMTEFTMMGMLIDIAKDLKIDIPTAGHLIALYALGVVVGAPVLVLYTSKYPPKKVLLYLMLAFVLFNLAFAIAPNNLSLMISRFLSGLPHGAFFGIGGVMATRLVDKSKAAQALAIMFTGMTVANLAGVPLGSYIGHHFSWRYTYLMISGFGLITMLALYKWLPALPNNSDGNIFKQLSYFKTKTAWIIIFMIAIGTGGLFAWISYIAPLMTTIAKIDPSGVPVVMVLVGLGMVVGNLAGGKLCDSIGAQKAIVISFGAMVVCLTLIYYTTHITPLAYVLAFITGAASFSCSPSLQLLLISTAKGSETMAAAAGQASFNLGNTLGAFLGGLPITYGLAYNTPSLVGIGMAGTGVLLTLYYIKTNKEKAVLKAAA